MRIGVSIITLFLIFAFSSCKTETQCPAFDNADLKHIAYAENDDIVFRSIHHNEEFEIKIHVAEINSSQSFNQKCEPDLYNQCPCANSVEIIANYDCDCEPFVFVKMEQSDVSELQNFHYNLLDFEFDIDFDNDLKYANDIPYLDFMPVFFMNDTIYEDVAIITNLDNPESEIIKVYVNKKDGILQYEDIFHHIWKREFKPNDFDDEPPFAEEH